MDGDFDLKGQKLYQFQGKKKIYSDKDKVVRKMFSVFYS